jgi:hypothetical protein
MRNSTRFICALIALGIATLAGCQYLETEQGKAIVRIGIRYGLGLVVQNNTDLAPVLEEIGTKLVETESISTPQAVSDLFDQHSMRISNDALRMALTDAKFVFYPELERTYLESEWGSNIEDARRVISGIGEVIRQVGSMTPYAPEEFKIFTKRTIVLIE